VFTEARRPAPDGPRTVAQADRGCDQPRPRLPGYDHVPLGEQRSGQGLFHGVDHRHAGIDVGKDRFPVGRASPAESTPQGVDDLLTAAVVVLQVHEFGKLQGPAQRLPEAMLHGPDGQVAAIGGRVDIVAGVAMGQAVVAAHRCAPLFVLQVQLQRQQAEYAVGHGDVDVLAGAGFFPLQQRQQNAHRGVQTAAGHVGDLHPGDDRRAAGFADQIQHAGGGQVIDVVTGAIPQRAGLPVAGDRTVHDARIDARQCSIVDFQPLHHPGPEALQHHVGVSRQAVENPATLAVLQIEGHVLLVAVNRGGEKIVRTEAPVFHGDHPRAVIGQDHGTVRPRQQPRKIEHEGAGQGALARRMRFALFHNSLLQSPRRCQMP